MSHVTCHMSCVTCHVSHVTCHFYFNFYLFIFSGQGGKAYCWRVCYQPGQPHLVCIYTLEQNVQKSTHNKVHLYVYNDSICVLNLPKQSG